MNCDEVQPLIDAYLDHELTIETSLAVQKHLQDCAGCSQIYANSRAVRSAIQSGSFYEPATELLRGRIKSSLDQQRNLETGQVVSPIPSGPALRKYLAIAAAVVVASCVSWNIGRSTRPASGDAALTQQIFSSDVRALMAVDGGIDIVSSNRHTVKPWFAGKLDFSPTVQDFGPEGFALVGGRRDYVAGRVVAVLVYRRRLHRINLYIWPGNEEESKTADHLNGYNMVHWSGGGMNYWAVSDLNTPELEQFSGLVQEER